MDTQLTAFVECQMLEKYWPNATYSFPFPAIAKKSAGEGTTLQERPSFDCAIRFAPRAINRLFTNLTFHSPLIVAVAAIHCDPSTDEKIWFVETATNRPAPKAMDKSGPNVGMVPTCQSVPSGEVTRVVLCFSEKEPGDRRGGAVGNRLPQFRRCRRRLQGARLKQETLRVSNRFGW